MTTNQKTSLCLGLAFGAAFTLAHRPETTAAAPPADVPGVSGMILRVADLGRSTAFYRERVGLPMRSANDEIVVFDGSRIPLMLMATPEPIRGRSTGPGTLTEVVLEVRDVRQAYQTLARRGIAFRTPLRAVTSAGDRQLVAADFRDPDGHLLSLSGWEPRKAPPVTR